MPAEVQFFAQDRQQPFGHDRAKQLLKFWTEEADTEMKTGDRSAILRADKMAIRGQSLNFL